MVSHSRLEGDLYGLMTAYIDQRKRRPPRRLSSAARRRPIAWTTPASACAACCPTLERWTPLHRRRAGPARGDGPTRASYVASTLSASLELVREGELEARQLEHSPDVYLRARAKAAA